MKISLMLFLLLGYLSHIASAQSNDNPSKTHLSSISLHKEYYNFNSQHQATYFLLKGGITFKDNSQLVVELIGTQYTEEGQKIFSPGDMNITYSRNLTSSNSNHFNGVTTCIKAHLPTGNSNLSGLFGHYTLEPMIIYGWNFGNRKFTFSNHWRAYIPTYQVNKDSKAPAFLRFEPHLKYQNKNTWVNVALDNRWVWNFDDFVMYYKIEGGIGLTDNTKLSGFYEKKIKGSALFNLYTGINISFKF